HTRFSRDWSSDVCSSDLFTLFTIFWLILILIFFNIFVYFYVIKITTESEEEIIANKVKLLLENPKIQSGRGLNTADLLNEYYNRSEERRVGKECRLRW